MTLSIIIPTYNAASTIQRCIEALLPQLRQHPRAEVIVVDSSEDETAQLVQAHSPPVSLIHLEQRAFQGHALNLGIQQAQGDILVTIDADCIVAPNFLECILRAHQSETLAIGGTILNGHPDNLTSWAEYFASASEYFEGSPRRFVRTMGLGNMSYKRELFAEYGGFPNIVRGEDVLFHHRLLQQGEKLLFDPTIQVFHLYRTQFKSLIRREIRCGCLRHQLRRNDPLPGQRLLYRSPLFLLYPPVKLLLIFWRLLRWNRTRLPLFFQCLPRLLLLLMATTLGMALSYSSHLSASATSSC